MRTTTQSYWKIKSKMEAVIEGMQSTETRLTSRMDDMEARLSADSNMFKSAVAAHSGEIQGLKAEVQGLQTEVQRLDTKTDHVDQRLTQVETRLSDRIDHVETRLSDKIDKQDSRRTDHENRITTLEKAANS